MGNKSSVIDVYIINCVACVFFLFQGVLMWRAAHPTMKAIEYLEKGNLDNLPADLRRHVSTDTLSAQRRKLQHCIYLSFSALLIVFISVCLRIAINLDVFGKEKMMFLSYKSMKDRNGSSADEDAAKKHEIIYAG